MKKTAMRVSGYITLFMFFLLLLVSSLCLCSALNVTAVADVINSNQIISGIFIIFSLVFINIPTYLLGLTGLELPAEITTIFAIAFVAFSLLMFIWGIKEVTLANRDNERFAKCKKTCAFMMFTKFMFFAYLVAIVVLSVIQEEIANSTVLVSEVLNVPYIFLIITGALAIISFVIFVLPVANIAVVYNAVKFGDNNGEQMQQPVNDAQGADGQELQSFYSQTPQPTMQANMPPMPGYKPQVVVQTTAQPNQQPNVNPSVVAQPQANATVAPQPQMAQPAQVAVQPAQVVQPAVQPAQPTAQPAAGGIVPGQDGVPANITEKGIADLQRLERLKSMGAITPENYAAMKQKICTENVG